MGVVSHSSFVAAILARRQKERKKGRTGKRGRRKMGTERGRGQNEREKK